MHILTVSSVWVAILTWSNFNSENTPGVAVSDVNGESEARRGRTSNVSEAPGICKWQIRVRNSDPSFPLYLAEFICDDL